MLQYTKAYSSFFSRLCINSDFYISASSKTWQGTAFILLKSTSPRLHIFFSLGRNSNEFAYTYCKPETLTALEAQLYLFILVVLSTTYITIIKEKRKKKKEFLNSYCFCRYISSNCICIFAQRWNSYSQFNFFQDPFTMPKDSCMYILFTFLKEIWLLSF